MRTILAGIAAGLAVCGTTLPCDAEPHDWDDLVRDGIVVDRQPNQAGGLASDTEFDYGGPSWQRVADDISLDTAAIIRRIVWWGFYADDNPPLTETMRVRFYSSKASDGLPGDTLFEESFLNPSRAATGMTVWVGVDPDEYVYEVDLAAPFELAASTQYWLEIVQVGDIGTRFRWEFSGLGPTGLAVVNDNAPFWHESLGADNALQLSTVPEPSAFGLIFLGAMLAGKWRSRKEV